jgi:hypothetical protein
LQFLVRFDGWITYLLPSISQMQSQRANLPFVIPTNDELRMGNGSLHLRVFVASGSGTADPSAPLRSGRDDKGEGGALSKGWFVAEGNNRSLHFATLRSG